MKLAMNHASRVGWVLALAIGIPLTAAAQIPQETAFNPAGLTPMSFTSKSCEGFVDTPSWKCTELQVPGYVLRAKDSRAVVFISHGSQGLDKRHADYAKALSEAGITAVVLGHWQARNLDSVQMDYDKGRRSGGKSTNQVIDVLSAATQLKETAEFKNSKIGHIGESMGGVTALNLTRPYLRRAFNEANGKQPAQLSALVALYPGCFDHFSNEAFTSTPLLFVLGAEDEDSPAKHCIEQAPYMKARGGNASVIVLEGEGHDFDAPYRQTRGKAQNPQKCWNNRDGDIFTLRETGRKYTGTADGFDAMMKDCIGLTWTKALYGHKASPMTGYKEWLGYFKQQLLGE